MKFPSLQVLGKALGKVLLRFPFEMGFAFLGTIAAIVLIELNELQVISENYCLRLIMVANLGLVLSLSLSLLSERHSYGTLKVNLLRVLIVLFTGGLFFFLDPLKRETDILRFVLLALAFHLLVSFSAFSGKSQIIAFWQCNKTIFLRFLTGGLYSAVLFLGLAAAIGAMNFLFNFSFEWDTFAILWVCIAGIFQTVFFLSGVPENLNINKADTTYPKGLKIFTQFVLIPLASVYAIILLAYELKILIAWELPKGLVSNLILAYAVFGILSLLLIYPVRNLDENKWLRTFNRSFYYVLIPLLLLLFWAVLARVIDYGITEERYFLIILALWLSFITIYFLISNKQDISLIPFSLALVTVFSIYGPQGAFAVSQRSQIRELQQLFNKYKSLEDGKIKALHIRAEKDDNARMLNIVDYLINMHGLESFDSLIEQDLEKVNDSLFFAMNAKKYDSRTNRWEMRSQQKVWLYNYLNLEADEADQSKLNLGKNQIEVENPDLLPLNKADYQVLLNFSSDTLSQMVNGRQLHIFRIGNQNKFNLQYGTELKSVQMDTLINHLANEADQSKRSEHEPLIFSRKILSQEVDFKEINVKVFWNRLSFNDHKDLLSANGYLLISLKE